MLTTKTMDPWDVTLWEDNPRKKLRKGSKDYESIRRSLEEFGLVIPLVWNKRTNRLVGGHQRITVIRDLGWSEVEVSVVDLSEEQEKVLAITLNRVEGQWDNQKLATVLAEIEASQVDVEITGFDGAELDKMLAKARVPEPDVVFTEELLEEHNYVVLYFDNTVDWESAKDVFGVKAVHALDSRPGYQRKGLGRVIRGATVVKELLEARSS